MGLYEWFFGEEEEDEAANNLNRAHPAASSSSYQTKHKVRPEQQQQQQEQKETRKPSSSKKKRGRDPPGTATEDGHVEEDTSETQDDSWQQSLLQGQQQRENDAKSQGLYVKKQRCHYFHKGSKQWFRDAHIAGVHFDDGPDRPYYTIVYTKKNEDGSTERIEKQTTPDRLAYADWDAEKSLRLLNP
jgi:hypothetical protein